MKARTEDIVLSRRDVESILIGYAISHCPTKKDKITVRFMGRTLTVFTPAYCSKVYEAYQHDMADTLKNLDSDTPKPDKAKGDEKVMEDKINVGDTVEFDGGKHTGMIVSIDKLGWAYIREFNGGVSKRHIGHDMNMGFMKKI